MQFFLIILLTTLIIINPSYAKLEVAEGEIAASFALKLGENKALYRKNENLSLNPASTLKAVTALIALKNLNHDFKFSTKLYRDVDKDNIYLEFDGNPYFNYSDLLDLFTSIEKREYKNLYVVYNEDENEHYSNGVNVEDTKFCFLAPSSQISINQNCEIFNLIESTSSYSPTKTQHSVKLIEDFSIIEDNSKEVSELDLKYLGANQYKLIGKSKKADLPKRLNIAVQDPKKFLLDSINRIEEERGIVFIGHKFIKKLPSSLKLISESNSPVLKDMLKFMMKKSDNHIADAFFKKISNTNSFKKAAKNFENEIYKIDKNIKFKIVDGSGVSVHNLISAKSMVSILNHGFFNSKIGDSYLEVFPSTQDSESNLAKYELEGRILHAKTGSLESSATLVGLISSANEDRIVFATFINNSLESTPLIRKKNAKILLEMIHSTFK